MNRLKSKLKSHFSLVSLLVGVVCFFLYKKFAAIEFNYSGSVKDATLSVSAPNNSYIQSISGNTAYVGANNSIRGNYTFKWTFDSNNNYLLDPKYKTLSGTFFIDGLNGSYQVSIDDGFGGVTVEVNGY